MNLSGQIEREEELNFRVFNFEGMGSESNGGNWNGPPMEDQTDSASKNTPYVLEKFTLFETPLNFYIIGRDADRMHWRVLKMDRSECSELLIHEDPMTYSYRGCKLLLQAINEANKQTGGLKFVTNFYGIVGFIRFLGPYYMILVTERKEIGQICGHPIYSISKYKMFAIPSTAWSCNYKSREEKRYTKLLKLMNITKDFFFSYSYPIMRTLQKNFCQPEMTQASHERMFVWNEYLARPIQTCSDHKLWTVALVHGFFKQVKLCISRKSFTYTLIARRSSHFAGTRYLKRGVDENGQAANEVEIEQIVWQEIDGEHSCKITSVVQDRGSMPLCWSQEPSWLDLKPDILLPNHDNKCKATQLHFENLHQRYGDPIILLNLVKKHEKKQRESLLSKAFRTAVAFFYEDWTKKCQSQLEFVNLDLDAIFRTEKADVLAVLKDPIAIALQKTGIFSSEMPQPLTSRTPFDFSSRNNSNCNEKHQKGILRSNCIDSLDRTNVAQYVYSYVALAHQLYTLGIIDSQELDFNHALAFELMEIYEAMGDSLAQQYGGSPAHSKIFSKVKGRCKVATELSEVVKTVQRHYSNSFIDASKQKAIDIFLGQSQPEVGELGPSRSNLNLNSNIGGVAGFFLNNISRMTPYISSGQLFIDMDSQWFGHDRSCFKEDADKFDPPCQTG